MRVLAWHVHGSWMTAFVQGSDEYLIPVTPDRGPDGRGRARTWDWPSSAREVVTDDLRGITVDVAVFQRPHELDLFQRWTGLRPGQDVPAIYVEHNAPTGPAPSSRHPLADGDITIAHVTHFNRIMWDCGTAPVMVVEHGIVDPGHLYTGERPSLAVTVNEPVRRSRVAGTDLALDLASRLELHFYGMQVRALAQGRPELTGRLHEDLPQHDLHRQLAQHRVYLHPYRWTSLGLALIEAMTLGMPVLALSTTESPLAVPPGTGVVSNDLHELETAARHWLAHPEEARATGLRARAHATSRYGLARFLADWDRVLKELEEGIR